MCASSFHLPPRCLKALFSALLVAFTAPPAIAQEAPPGDPGQAETYGALLEDLEGLRLDLNRAPVEDLQALPWLSAETARRIEAYRGSAGPFRRIDDLLRVPGISPELLDAIRPYLVLASRRRLAARTRLRLTRPSGYASRWRNLRLYGRAEVGLEGRLEAVLLTERDPEEPGLADFYTGYARLSGIPGLPRVLLGDFRPGFGQGLIFSRRARASTGLAWAGPGGSTRLGNRAGDESGFLRGLYAEAGRGRFTAALLLSSHAWDAATDSAGATGLRTGGRHVTRTEQDRRGSLKERLAALRLAWNVPPGRLGATAGRAAFSPSLSGDAHHAFAGLDWNLSLRRLSLFGEAAASAGGAAWLSGARIRLDRIRLVLLARRYGPGYLGLRSAAFSAYSGPPQNEWGLFAGAAWTPTRRVRLEAGLDRHGRLQPAGDLPLPGRGERFDLALRRSLPRGLALRLALSSSRETVRTAGKVGPRLRRRLQIRFTARRAAARLAAWLEGTRSRTPARNGRGAAAGLECRLHPGAGPDFAVWAVRFRATAYESRIYAFEPDVWGGSRLQVLTGAGTAGGLRLGWGGRLGRIAARYSIKRTETGASSAWALQVDLGTSE